jgi:hypothetical protein
MALIAGTNIATAITNCDAIDGAPTNEKPNNLAATSRIKVIPKVKLRKNPNAFLFNIKRS